MNRSCPGTSTKASSPTPGSVGPAVAELDREPAPALLVEPVRVLAGERPDQRGLAVVDVPGGGDDVHLSARLEPVARPGGRLGQVVVRSAGTASRSSSSRPSRDVPEHGGLTAAQGLGEGAGSATAALGSVTPGAPPPPTAA